MTYILIAKRFSFLKKHFSKMKIVLTVINVTIEERLKENNCFVSNSYCVLRLTQENATLTFFEILHIESRNYKVI